jgi:uncharacterized protein YggT (Ycf19 family)
MWDTLFNLFLMLFWVRFWGCNSREWTFNRYLAPIRRAQQAVLTFLQPVFGRLSEGLMTGVVFAFLLIFRGLAAPQSARWALGFGFVVRRVDAANLFACVAFSVLSFAVFIFKIWSLSLIYVGPRRQVEAGPASALQQLARPLTAMAGVRRPAFLLVCGMLLAWLLNRTGQAPAQFAWSPAPFWHQALRLAVASLAAWVAVLPLLQSLLILLIIGSWVSMFTHTQGLMWFCRDWLDMLIGPLRRYPMRLGMIDLTPLVFMFALSLLHSLLTAVLWRAYAALV